MSAFPSFQLERYFAQYEFTVKHQLSCSDGEAVTLKQLLEGCDDECKALWDNLTMAYTESSGHPLLLQEIAKRYQDVTSSDLLVGAPQELIYISMKMLTDHFKNDSSSGKPHAIVMFPGYQSLYVDAEAGGCDVTKWNGQWDAEKGWRFDISELQGLLQNGTRLLVVNVPHNPTGWYPSQDEWSEMMEFCRKHDLYLFSDEMYSMMPRHDGVPPNKAACDLYNKAITLAGVSKTLCGPGLRIGWIAMKDKDMLRRIAGFKDYTTICSSAPSEILSLMSLRAADSITSTLSTIARRNLEAADQFFSEFSNLFEWKRPVAGTTAFVMIKGWIAKQGTGGATGFADLLRENQQILITPSKLFDYEDKFFRLGYGRSNVVEIFDILRKYLQQNNSEK